ncbi:YciI family protein [Chitinophagaceae bacterium MMS25-I14]
MIKIISFSIALGICSFYAKAQVQNVGGVQIQKTEEKAVKNDTKLKQYYFVMLTKGKKRDEIKDTNVLKKIQDGHLANIRRLADEGKIVVVGPFGDDGNWRGIFIFNCTTKEEVEKLLATDPAIKAGRLSYEIHPWWTEQNSVFK